MIDEILNAAGLPHRAGRFPDPPGEAFAVYFDEVETDGPDGHNMILRHGAMVEIYALTTEAAEEAGAALEAVLDAKGIPWTKQACYWLKQIQRYQVIYEFDYIEKRRT